jgi:hypothetical protein
MWTYAVARKYQFMEANMQRRAAGLKDKMPDIQKTLETVQFLKTRKVYWLRQNRKVPGSWKTLSQDQIR